MARKIDLDAVINRIRMKMQGSHPSSPASGYDYLYIISGSPHGGLYLKDPDGQQIGPFITGSSGAWSQQINESGASFANWTSNAGTWSSDGTVIKQTDTAAAYTSAYFTTKQPIAPGYVLEADVKMVSTGAGSLRLVTFVVGYSGANNNAGPQAGLQNNGGTRTVEFNRAFTTTLLSVSYSFSDDTFYRLKVVTSGGFITAYVDGVLIGNSGNTPATAANAQYVGLSTYACEGHFKNIKGYSLALP